MQVDFILKKLDDATDSSSVPALTPRAMLYILHQASLFCNRWTRTITPLNTNQDSTT